MKISRRRFIQVAGAGSLIGTLPIGAPSFAESAIPVGLALYTIDPAIRENFEGTLAKVAKMGFRQIELSYFLNRTGKQLRTAFDAAGLKCESGIFHLSALEGDIVPGLPANETEYAKAVDSDLPKVWEFAHDVGIKYITYASFPHDPKQPLTLDDFKRAAELFNKVGAQAKKAGLHIRVHQHNKEFTKFGDVVGYDEMLRLTDPQLVSMEMDCAWVVEAGYDPVEYLRKYPKRITSLHLRDRFAPGNQTTNMNLESVEIGKGVIKWKPIMAAAKAAGVAVAYIESDTTTALGKMAALMPIKGGASKSDPAASLALAKGSLDYLNSLF